jgi:hypothetical protein
LTIVIDARFKIESNSIFTLASILDFYVTQNIKKLLIQKYMGGFCIFLRFMPSVNLLNAFADISYVIY